MELLGELKKTVLSARASAFLRSPALQEPQRRAIWLQEVGSLIRFQSRLPRHPMEEAELPLDRLLLHGSRNYRRTRKVARTLGIALQPRLMSRDRALEEFDPESRVVPFSPVQKELTWLWSASGPRGRRKLDALLCLGAYVSSTYHDLNHAILFRLLRPAPSRSPRASALEFYFALTEALAGIRDLQLGNELGTVSGPLRTLGVAYASVERFPQLRNGHFETDDFSSLIRYNMSRMLGAPYAAEQERLLRARGRIESLRKLGVSQLFIEGTVGDWVAEYRRRNGLSLRLPAPRSVRGLPALQIGLSSPRAFFSDENAIGSLDQWFKGVFALEGAFAGPDGASAGTGEGFGRAWY